MYVFRSSLSFLMIFLFIFLVGAIFVNDVHGQQSCTARYQCSALSTDYNYVDCIIGWGNSSGQCKCIAELGFVGNATSSNKCRCEAPYSVYWTSGIPYCIKYVDGVQYKLDKTRNDLIVATQKGIYIGIKHPQPQITLFNLINGFPDPYLDYFTPDTVGRVSPVGTFAGLALVVEYYGGATFTGASRIVDVNFNGVGAYNNTGWVNVDLTFNVMNSNQTAVARIYNLTQSGFDRYNSAGKIYSADKIIHNLGAAVKWVGTLNFSSPALHAQICTVLLTLSGCNSTYDPLGFYSNFSDCTTFLGNRKAGSLDDTLFDADTVACAYFHMVFTRVDPATHCQHAGKTGGGKCRTSSYATYYLEKYRKKRSVDVIETVETRNAVLTDILMSQRLEFLDAGIPANSPLITITTEKIEDDIKAALTPIVHHGHGHKKDPIAMTNSFVRNMRANNFALLDSIMLPQAQAFIDAGLSPDHPIIRDPLERMNQRRKKRSMDQAILDLGGAQLDTLLKPKLSLPAN